jgi:3-hydroxymyristoyl/3-hydroxydecanoyl-(acyl carrier protein) dehydratase
MTYSFTINASHPSLKGHFPNNPIVPGVVILDEVINLLQELKPNITVDKISMVKFTHTLLAEQKVNVEINEKSETLISFTCSYNEVKLVTGQFVVKAVS